MKKLSLVVVLSLLFSMIVYGEDLWKRGYSNYMVLPVEGVTRIGIGTPGPMHPLDVNGTIRTKGFIMTTGKQDGYVLTSDGSGVGTWQAPSGGGSCLWSSGLGGIYYDGGSVGIFDLGASNDVSVLAISENTNTLDEFVFKGDFAGTGETGNALKLETHWADNVMTWRGDGNVGIGISTLPEEKLEVAGIVKMNGFKLPTGAVNDYVLTSDGDGIGTWQPVSGGSLWSESGGDIYYNTGDVGIGVTSPGEKLEVAGTIKMNGFKLPTGASNNYVLTSDVNGVGTWQSIPFQWLRSGEDDIYYNTGNVCVGTDTPESEFTVDGTITTREMKVQLTGWPDFVFEKNHKLMPLSKLEKHIKKQKSLPGIPTNKQVVKEGVLVGEMQAKLLEKVEELTLYVIELDKEVKDLREENENLKEKISTLVK